MFEGLSSKALISGEDMNKMAIGAVIFCAHLLIFSQFFANQIDG